MTNNSGQYWIDRQVQKALGDIVDNSFFVDRLEISEYNPGTAASGVPAMYFQTNRSPIQMKREGQDLFLQINILAPEKNDLVKLASYDVVVRESRLYIPVVGGLNLREDFEYNSTGATPICILLIRPNDDILNNPTAFFTLDYQVYTLLKKYADTIDE
jgi:hypothetical protein